MAKKYDAIVIGTGQAGPSLAVRLAGTGMKVAIIERKRFGGTCVNNGCIPTKTLVASARAAHVARRASDYGVTIGSSIAVDMKKVKERKDAVVRQSSEGVEKWLRDTQNLTVIKGHALLADPHRVRVGDELLEADKIFINVGGRASVPPLRGIDEVSYLNNSTMMDVEFLPEHLIIIGGSYVGLEFAQMYRRFGSEVTVVERGPRLIKSEDEDVSENIKTILEGEGVKIRLSAECIGFEKRGDKVPCRLIAVAAIKRSSARIRFSRSVVCRTPTTLAWNTPGLKSISAVTSKLMINFAPMPGIYALADWNGRGAFTHTAYNDYEIVAANLLDGDQRRVSDRITAYALYIDPPLGRAGMTEAEVRKSGRKALIGKRPMTQVGRAREKGETDGFMKVLVDAETKKILGASLLGIECDEVIHSILDVMYANAPYTVIQRAMHIHPTVTELIPTMLGELKPLE
jgi:pyruvate/2-oxoglutarate dehydrogenase complex dihydrolipoamide dehydrogenase (E3) component